MDQMSGTGIGPVALRCLQYVGALFVALCMGLLSSSYSVAESDNDNKATVVGMLVATTPQCGVRLDSLLHTCISATDVPPFYISKGTLGVK